MKRISLPTAEMLARIFGSQSQLELFSYLPSAPRTRISCDVGGRGLFEGGPPIAMQLRLGLMHPDRPRVAVRALLAAAIGWFPLLLLSALQSLSFHDGSFVSFVTDYGVFARSLIAAPVLILADGFTASGLSAVARHFHDAGLLAAKDVPRYRSVVLSTYRLRDSIGLEIAVFAVVFALTAYLSLRVPLDTLLPWHGVSDTAGIALSPAGFWYSLVSLPLLILLLLGWLWRIALWTRFLWSMSRLNLHLVPAHPDGAAGLKFVGMSLMAFAVLAFAFGVIVAGVEANRVVHENADVMSLRYPMAIVLVFSLILFAGPTFVFVPNLMQAWRHGVFEYGALARSLGRQMELRWLHRRTTPESLDANDFSATTDLYAIVANAYGMNIVPIGLKNLAVLSVGALLPFLPVTLIFFSPADLLHKITGFLQ